MPKHRGLSWFAFPTDLPGVTIRQIRRVDETAEFCQDFFNDVIIPDLYRIGDVIDGWAVSQTMLVYERGPATAQSVTTLRARACLRRIWSRRRGAWACRTTR